MLKKIFCIGKKHPIFVILTIAFLVRLMFAAFSNERGYEHEHFLYIEMPNAWIDNAEYQSDTYSYNKPKGISLFYLSLNYAWIAVLKFLGINSLTWLTFFSRLLHAFLSLFVISFGYRITELMSNKRTASMVAMTLAFLYIIPYSSIHNTPYFVCIAFLMYSTLIILRQEINRYGSKSVNVHRTSFLIAGFFLGLAFSICYSVIPYIVGIILTLMLCKNVKNALITLLGFLVSISIALVIPDLLVWGKPFTELKAYIETIPQLTLSANQLWISLTSIILFLLILIPPFSIMLLCGFFNKWKSKLLLFLPTLLSILYNILHYSEMSYMIPIIPVFIILGIIGWKDIKDNSTFWQKNNVLHKILIGFSIVINFVILLSMLMYK